MATHTKQPKGKASAPKADAPDASFLPEIDAAVKDALARGDHASYAVLSDLQVAVGALKHKAQGAVSRLQDADAALAEQLAQAL